MSVSEQGPFLFPHHTCVPRWADAFQLHSFKGLFQAPRGSEVMTPFSTHYLMECQRFRVHLWNSSKLIRAGVPGTVIVSSGEKKKAATTEPKP